MVELCLLKTTLGFGKLLSQCFDTVCLKTAGDHRQPQETAKNHRGILKFTANYALKS